MIIDFIVLFLSKIRMSVSKRTKLKKGSIKITDIYYLYKNPFLIST